MQLALIQFAELRQALADNRLIWVDQPTDSKVTQLLAKQPRYSIRCWVGVGRNLTQQRANPALIQLSFNLVERHKAFLREQDGLAAKNQLAAMGEAVNRDA